jgi:hypothetical protein
MPAMSKNNKTPLEENLMVYHYFYRRFQGDF